MKNKVFIKGIWKTALAVWAGKQIIKPFQVSKGSTPTKSTDNAMERFPVAEAVCS